MTALREVQEGTQMQGIGESIAYYFPSTPWASTPVVTQVKAYDITHGERTDVTSTILTGSASVAGDVITTPVVTALTVAHTYRVEVKFTSGGLTWMPYIVIEGEY